MWYVCSYIRTYLLKLELSHSGSSTVEDDSAFDSYLVNSKRPQKNKMSCGEPYTITQALMTA